MKKIFIGVAMLATILTIGCKEQASLDSLESRTKEEVTSGAETAESKAVEAALNYTTSLAYNWVCNYQPTSGANYEILLKFDENGSVSTDSPQSDSPTNLALTNVYGNAEGGVSIKFEGSTMFQDAMISPEFHESTFDVVSVSSDNKTIRLKGKNTDTEFELRYATNEDVSKLGEKIIWTEFIQHKAMNVVLRDGEEFVARYNINREQKAIEIVWIDATTQKAVHKTLPYTIDITEDAYTVSWESETINGNAFSALEYNLAQNSVSTVGATLNMTQPILAEGGFVEGNTKNYYLGGRQRCGQYPEALNCIEGDWLDFVFFYPFNDDIPVEMRVMLNSGEPAASNQGYLFVNDYTQDPKTPIIDSEGDWVRFYPNLGEFPKDPFGTAGKDPVKTPDEVKEIVKPFTDFYFAEGGLYVVDVTDANGGAFYLISATSDLWVKVRSSIYSDMQ